MQINKLIPVIKVDDTKCLNCHACITACPVKYCNQGSGQTVTINHDLCIGCGKCIEACTHNARSYIDDFANFIADIIADKKIIAISAPAIAASFPEQYLQLNTWLKTLGIDAIFDVSFGAELTSKSYIDFINKEKPKTLISQPCAAIVTYIQIYKPELIQYLAPTDSPMLHTIKMIKQFYPQYKNHKIAVLSPCAAKKREFEETGLGDYNIAQQSIYEFLQKEKIDLNKYSKTDFDNHPAERAVMFSSPGGLMKTVERSIPDISDNTRKIEGNPHVYKYLETLEESIKKNSAPLLIDCLSCDHGCNTGPLSISKSKPVDQIENLIKKRSKDLKNKYLKEAENDEKLRKINIDKILEKYSKAGLYNRAYLNLSGNNNLLKPSEQEMLNIYESMHKDNSEDIKNCSACGYGSCESMAVAIHNGLNKAENCHFYLQKESEYSHEEVRLSKEKLSTMFKTATDGFIEVNSEQIIVFANDACNEIFNEKHIVGKSLFEFVDKTGADIIKEQIKQRKEDKKSSYELDFINGKNSRVKCRVSASPLATYTSEGKKIGSFAIITDISDLVKAQEQLKAANESLEEKVNSRTKDLSDANEELLTKSLEMSELIEELNTTNQVIESINEELEKLSIVASETTNSVIIMDNNGHIEWVNDAYVNTYGFAFAKSIIDSKKSIVHISSCRDIKEILEQVIDDKIPAVFKSYEKNKRGENIFILTTLSPVIKNGDLTKLVAINSDITELQKAKEEIQQRNEEIQQQKEELTVQRDAMANSEAQIKKILESLPNAGFVIDAQGKVIYWNKAMENMTGIHSTDIIGKGNYEYSLPFYGERTPILIDLVATDENTLFEKYSGIEKSGNVIKAETFVPSLKGKKRFLIGTATAFFNSKGEYSGAIEIIHDITERKEIQHKLEQNKQEIELKNKEITDSIHYAGRIQKAILPKTTEFKDYLNEYFILYKPKDIISGDFFWIKQVKNRIIVVAADCTGHGVPGAFMSMLGISFLNEIITKNNTQNAGQILDSLRKKVKTALNQTGKTFEQKDGMDITLLNIDYENMSLNYAAANNSAILIRNKQIIELDADKMPIGVHHKEKPFSDNTIEIQENDFIYAFSDGYKDQFGGKNGRKFLAKNFKNLLLDIHEEEILEQKILLRDNLHEWMSYIDENGHKYIQVDDILVMGIKIQKNL